MNIVKAASAICSTRDDVPGVCTHPCSLLGHGRVAVRLQAAFQAFASSNNDSVARSLVFDSQNACALYDFIDEKGDVCATPRISAVNLGTRQSPFEPSDGFCMQPSMAAGTLGGHVGNPGALQKLMHDKLGFGSCCSHPQSLLSLLPPADHQILLLEFGPTGRGGSASVKAAAAAIQAVQGLDDCAFAHIGSSDYEAAYQVFTDPQGKLSTKDKGKRITGCGSANGMTPR